MKLKFKPKFLFISTTVLVLLACKKEFPNSNTQVFGHAGESLIKAKSTYPPNSSLSINRAIDLGVDGVEIDVQMSADGILVAYHDEFLDDNSTGSGCINSQNFNDFKDVLIYKSDQKIEKLEEVISVPMIKGKQIMLDIKHYNACEQNPMDYAQFNSAFNTLLSIYTADQKEKIIVNCSNHFLLDALSDTLIQKSLESDEPENAIATATQFNYQMLTVKLDKMSQTLIDAIQNEDLKIALFQIKTRNEINRALTLNPDFVISDNIPCTLKSING